MKSRLKEDQLEGEGGEGTLSPDTLVLRSAGLPPTVHRWQPMCEMWACVVGG
jgi:hypothetical protein